MKQFLQKTLRLRAWMMVAMMVAAITGAWADVTVTMNSFVAISGNVDGDENISFEAAKGSAGTAPGVYSNEIRVYQNGGLFTVSANNGVKIKSITLGSSMATKVTYSVDNGTASDDNDIIAGGTITISDLDCSSVLFTCTGTSKTARLYVNSLSVTYTTGGGDTPTLDNSDLALIDAPIDLSFDLYNNSSAQVISYTTSSTGAVTIADNDYATFDIDEDNKTITVTPTAVTPSAQTITVSQAADDTYKAGSATFTVTISDSTPVPTHTVTFSVNGETTTSEVEEGAVITFPTDISDQEGKSFVGWVTEAIDGVTNEAPEFVTSATMGESDVTFYAVFASVTGTATTKTDTLTNDIIGGVKDTYKDWSGKSFTSTAVYAGHSAGAFNSIQLRTKNSNSGIISTTSGGKVKKVTVEWNDNTTAARTLNVYGSNTAYSGVSDLYGNKSGTKLGSFVYSDAGSRELNIDGDYEYIGIRSDDSALYLTSISITWSTGSTSVSGYCTTVAAETRQDAELAFSVDEVNANISEQFEAPTLYTAEGFNGYIEYSSSNESVAQILDSETGELGLIGEGTTIITATFDGDENYLPGSASYTLNVTDNRIATTTSVEDIVLDIADIATLTQLNPVVKDAEDNIIDCTYEDFPPKVSYEIVSDDNYIIGSLDNNSGEITLNDVVGTATLKAYYNYFRVSNTYKPSECTFTITVESTQTIAEARAQGTGSVTTKGVVTSCSGTTAYIQDANAAICVYGSELTVGDEIKVSGTLKTYNGLLEITNPTVTVLSQNNTVTPEVMTIAEINVSENQGWLVKIEDATVTAINGQNTTIAQGDNTIVVRGITDVAIAVDDVITLTGNIGCFNAAQIANPTDVTFKVSTPTFDPESGEVMAGSAVAISTTTEDATIYYTTNGDEPTTESTVYTDPITINEDQTIKAIAVKDGMTNSDVATATYTIIVTPTVTLNPNSIEATAAGAAGSVSLTYANLIISDVSEFDVQYYDVEGEETVAPDWIDVEVTEDNSDYVVSYLIAENTDTEARTAYFKVYAMDDETNLVYSNLVTVSQAGYVIDYATLPFEWNDDDTTSPQGVTNSGVGTYTSTPKLKFDGTGDYLILKINERPGTLTFDIKGNSFSGGTFNVQTSEDGVTYTDLETYTELGNTQNEEFNNLGENVRYIKWIYTEKVSGNVALGNIALAKYVEPQPAQEYELSWSVGENVNEIFVFDNDETVSLQGSGAQVLAGNTVYVSVSFNDGYELDQLTVSAGETPVDVTEIESGVYYSFVMPAAAVEIYATAKVKIEPEISEYTYELVAEASTLTAGDVIIIANGDATVAMGSQTNNNRAAAAIVTENNNAIVSANAGVQPILLEGNADGWYFYVEKGYLYAASSSSNYLRTEAEADDNAKATIGIRDDGNADITFQGTNSRNTLCYNSSNNIFSCYSNSNSQNDVQIYRLVSTNDYSRPVTSGSYGTLCLPNNAIVEGVELYNIAGKTLDEERNPKRIVLEAAGVQAVAGQAYIFKAISSELKASYVGNAVTETKNDNGFIGSLEYTPVEEGNYILYEGSVRMCGTGCSIGANRAYIDMSQVKEYTGSEASVKMLSVGDIVVGIAGIGAEGENGSAIYNIAGQRVQKVVRGLYIVDGKKVLVK